MHMGRERLKGGVGPLVAMDINEQEPAPPAVLGLGRYQRLCGR